MGSQYSQLKKYTNLGNERKCVEIYRRNAQLRKRFNANVSIDDTTFDTYMHVSAQKGMVEFLKILLREANGNPNTLNRCNQNVLHSCCNSSNDQRQYECMQVILQWYQKAQIRSHHRRLDPEININEQDIYNNTPLHYAAMWNLFMCVESLVAHGAYIFVENIERLTPSYLAKSHGHKEVALFLDSKLIINNDDGDKEMNEDDEYILPEETSTFGLGLQDLQEEKDKLLLETAEMINCSIFAAENLLKNHSWSKELLLSSWLLDPVKCYEKCGISTPPSSAVLKKITNNNQRKASVNTADLTTTDTRDNLKDPVLSNFQKTNSNFDMLGSSEIIIASHAGDRQSQMFSSLTTLNRTNKQKKNAKSKNLLSGKDKKRLSTSRLSISETNLKYESGFESTNQKADISTSSESGGFNSSLSNESDIDSSKSSTCRICFMDLVQDQTSAYKKLIGINCGHRFCRPCWESYLTMKINEGNVTDIVCPELNCFAIVSHDVIEKLVSADTAKRFLDFDIRAFVDQNPNIKWCPFPVCGMAVKNPKSYKNNKKVIHKKVIIPNVHEQHNVISDYSMTVDCGQGHSFCWDCLQEGHEPATCQNWKDWNKRIDELNPETLTDTSEKEEQSANYLWLVTHSNNCPNQNCLAPIQKHEGCNHVRCYKCKHEFCWVCLEPWKKHSGSTGGYFQCNRFEATNKVYQNLKKSISEAEDAHVKAAEANKFAHYYSRFKNHEHSLKIEKSLFDIAKSKFEVAQEESNDSSLINSYDTYTRSVKTESQNSSFKSSSFKRLSTRLSRKISKKQSEASIHKPENNDVSEGPPISVDAINLPATNEDLAKSDNNTKDTEINTSSAEGSNSIATVANQPTENYKFIEDAIKELVRTRRILQCSYVYGFYLDHYGHRKFIFEYIQTEYEESTENLSQMIARPHPKTCSKSKVLRLTNRLRRKRIEFLDTIRAGLNSFNETPPAFKRHSLQRWKFLLKDNIQHDEEFINTVAVSLKDLSPKNPWIIDKKGRHTNLIALLNNLPELEEELNNILIPSKEKNGLCTRWDCTNLRALNKLSGHICNYCSIRCMRIDRQNFLGHTESFKTSLRSITSIETSLSVCPGVKASTSKPHRETSNQKNSAKKSSSIMKFVTKRKRLIVKASGNNTKPNQLIKSTEVLEHVPNPIQASIQNSITLPTDLNEIKVMPNTDNPDSTESNAPAEANREDNGTPVKTSGYPAVPFVSLFLKKDEDISNIIKNMENVVYEIDDSKIAKTCNFELKAKD